MKLSKFIGIVLGTLVGLVLIIALFAPKEFKYEKSIVINAPIEKVWENVNSLSALDKWSPWNAQDPNMKKELIGVDGTIGAIQNWESKIVGSGSQTIETIDKPAFFETKLDFYKPHKTQGKSYVKLTKEKSHTRACWGMTGKIAYPVNIMILFMNIEKDQGKDWDNGLSKLKMISESK